MFYIFHGPDELSRKETLADFKAQMGDPAMADLNTTLLDGDAVTLGQLREASDALPFLFGRRLVVVTGYLTRPPEDPQRDKRRREERRRQADKKTLEPLAEYLKTLADTTRLIFVEEETLPASHPILILAGTHKDGIVKAFTVPVKGGLLAWIEQRVRVKGASIEHAAAQALAEAVPDDTMLLDSEIDKMITYVYPDTTITSAHVDLLCPYTGASNVFVMVDAIGGRDGPVALRMLHKLLDENSTKPEYPLSLLGMIVRQFRILIQVKEMSAQRVAVSTIAKRAGLHPFVAEKTMRQSLNFTMGELDAIYPRLLNTDLSIKTGKMDGVLALDTFVAAICAQE